MGHHKAGFAIKAGKSRDAEKLIFELGAHDSLDSAVGLAASILERLRGLDFHCYEGMPAQEAVPHLMRGPVSDAVRAVNESMRLVRILPRLVGADQSIVEDEDTRVELAVSPDAGVSEGTPQPYVAGPTAAVDIDLDAALAVGAHEATPAAAVPTASQRAEFTLLCGRTVAHLKASLEALRDARRDRVKWELISAGEEARRIARKSLRATCRAAMRLMAVSDSRGHFARDVSELQTALWVRAALMAFATDMQELTQVGSSIDGVNLGMHLRDVRIRMLQLFGDAHYSELRAPDRYKLQDVFGRMCRWLDQAWENFTEARELMAQATALSEALARVNARDVLLAHDAAVARQARAKLHMLAARSASEGDDVSAGLWRHLTEALELLARMRWRDVALDQLVLAQLMELKPTAVDRTALQSMRHGRPFLGEASPRTVAELRPRIDLLVAALDRLTLDEAAAAAAADTAAVPAVSALTAGPGPGAD